MAERFTVLVGCWEWDSNMKFFRQHKGFTLIELLIVVAIIGVLAAVGTDV